MNLTSFQIQIIFMYCSIGLDVVINAVAGTVSHDLATQIAVLFVQGLGLFVGLIVVYLLLARTWYFEAGLFGLVVSKFRGVFWILPINFLLTMGMRGYYVALALSEPSIARVWQNPPIFVLGVAQKIFSFIYYIVVFRLLLRVGQPRLYKPTPDEIDRTLRGH